MIEITKGSTVVMQGKNLDIICRYCRKFNTTIAFITMRKYQDNTGNAILTFKDGGITTIDFSSFNIMDNYFKGLKYAKQAVFLPIIRYKGGRIC